MSVDWTHALLGEVCTLTRGRLPTEKTPPGDYPFVVTAEQRRTASEYQIEGEAVCIPTISSTGHGHASLKRIHYESGRFAVANLLVAAEVKPGVELNTKYLYLYLDHKRDELIVPLMKGTANVNLNAADLANVRLHLPPLAEQRRIVDLVQAVDTTTLKTEELAQAQLLLLDAVRERVFCSDDSDEVLLGELCGEDGIQIGPFGSQLHAADYQPDGIPTVMPKDIKDGRIVDEGIARIRQTDWQRLKKHQLRSGDIVLPRRGDLSKRALVTNAQEGWLCGTGSVRVRLRPDLDAELVFEALSTRATDRWLSDNAVGTTMPNLNTTIVSRLPVRLPQGKTEDIVGLLKELAIATDAAHACNATTISLRNALLSELLSGTKFLGTSYDTLLESA